VACSPIPKLGKGEAVSESADKQMVEILKRQKFRDAMPAGLPAGSRSRTRRGPSPEFITMRGSFTARAHTLSFCSFAASTTRRRAAH
jgi:hypothetical protein